jgi:hypothetical protein
LVGLVAFEVNTSRDFLEESVVHTNAADVAALTADVGELVDSAAKLLVNAVVSQCSRGRKTSSCKSYSRLTAQ